mmetsp:Transcript_32727/g.83625  ORF Transcript_32727/g.83625 Transcript_32727/m.83625 type:complete len:226 (+) Transcript_32727:782-1459(+)
MSGGQRDAQLRANDDDDGSTKLNGEPTGRGNTAHLDSNSTHDLVAIGGQAKDNAKATQHKNPDGHRRLLGKASVLVDSPDRSEGTNGVGNIVGTMRERIADGSEDLQVLEGLLSLRVELLGELVDVVHILIIIDGSVDIMVSTLADRHTDLLHRFPAGMKGRPHDLGLLDHLNSGILNRLTTLSILNSLCLSSLRCILLLTVNLPPQKGHNSKANDERGHTTAHK